IAGSVARAADAPDVASTVVGPDGRPVAGADVWLVPLTGSPQPVPAAAHEITGADGQFRFGKELIDGLWKKSTYAQVIVRDRDGRLGLIYYVYPGAPQTPSAVVKLRDVGEVRGRVVGEDGRPAAGTRLSVRLIELAAAGQRFA